MTHRALAALVLVGIAACAREPSGPSTTPGESPAFVISDGAHGSGNPDFFFLPPMVGNPGSDPDFTANGFNPNLGPALTVTVCALNVANNANESAVLPSTPCKSGGYVTTFSGNQIVMILSQQLYKAEWQIPNSPETYYRITVKLGSTVLGTADVKTANSGNTNNFVVEKDGKTLPIKFRIESGALCSPAGTTPCSTNSIDPDDGGTVFYVVNGQTRGGVTIPPQPGGGPPIVVSFQDCATGNIGVDIPVFGFCITITTDPVLVGLTALQVPGSAFICEMDAATTGLSATQEELVTLHRRHNTDVFALPHTADSCPVVVGARGTISGFMRALVQGDWKAIRGELYAMVAPKPLYARRLDAGAGGITSEFSDFQFALPSKMEVASGSGGQGETVDPQSNVSISALVTDLLDQPVENAKVHFTTTDGTVGGLDTVVVLSNGSGLATATWTTSSAQGTTVNAKAYGFGIATEDTFCEICLTAMASVTTATEGPRSIFDPFMAIQTQFNPVPDPVPNPLQPVELGTGALFYSAFNSSNVIIGSTVKGFERLPSAITAKPTARKFGPQIRN